MGYGGNCFLGDPDSEELWTEIIDKIPDEVFLNPDIKILNVACGYGTESKVIVRRMRKLGFDNDYINNRIYVLDKAIWATNRMMLHGRFKNVIRADFLTWETDMKFDIVVGNPPYQASTAAIKCKNNKQGGFWWAFLTKAVELSSENTTIAMIVPTSIFSISNFGKETNKITFIYKNNFKFIGIYPDVSHHFNVGIRISAFVMSKNYVGQCLILNNNDSTYCDVDASCPIPFDVTPDNLSILNKTYSSKKWKFTECDKSKESDLVVKINGGRFKKYDKLFIGRSSDTNHSAQTMVIADTKNLANYKTIFNSKLFCYVFKILGGEAGQSSTGILQSLPMVDTNMAWSDVELYNHFNLTNKEIELIEKIGQ
jgi:hypothetical protein